MFLVAMELARQNPTVSCSCLFVVNLTLPLQTPSSNNQIGSRRAGNILYQTITISKITELFVAVIMLMLLSRALAIWLNVCQDHSLIRSSITMHVVPMIKHNRKTIPKKFDVSELMIAYNHNNLSSNCDLKLTSVHTSDSIEYE